jgi:SAM-dependent methyltransferase
MIRGKSNVLLARILLVKRRNIMQDRRLPILFLAAALLFSAAIPAPLLCGQTYLEQQTNERQPPDKVLAAIGVKPGMVIGEVGAGRGRYTVHLARGVGDSGKVYANDINAASLEYLRRRCADEGIRNVETILGEVEDPLFPPGALDMAFMVLTYHHLAKPVELLKNLIPSLKPGAIIVVIDPDPERDEDGGGHESTSAEKMRRDASRAGLQVVRIETFLERDNIFILRVKPILVEWLFARRR